MATGTICFGSSFTALKQKGFQWLDSHAGTSPESARFLEANDYQRDAIADAWRETHSGLRLTVTGFGDFAVTIHERLAGPYPDIETLDRRRMIEQALLALDAQGDLVNARQHTPAISELFRELEADGVQDIASLRGRLAKTDCTPDQEAVVVTAYEQYLDLRETLAHPEAVPRNAKLAAVADTDQSLQELLPHLDAIVVSGFIDPSSVELAVIERLAEEYPMLVLVPTPTPAEPTRGVGAALAEAIDALTDRGFKTEQLEATDPQPLQETTQQLYQPVDPPATPPQELSWHEAPTPDREIRHLARKLRERLATDEACSPNDILVLAPGLLSYREGIADVFDAYGIDHAYRVSILLERTYAGRAVLDAIEFCEQPRTELLGRLVTNPLVDLPAVDETEITDLQRRLYTTALGPFGDRLEQSEAGVESLLEDVVAVRDAEPDEVIPAIEALLDQLGLKNAVDSLNTSATIDAGYERSALARVEQILSSVQTVCESLDPDDPLTEAATALEGVRVPPPLQVTDDRVEIIGLQDSPMAEFEELYVLGATAEYLSGHETRPRYFQAIGEALDLFERHRQRDRDRYRFGMLLANAKRAHITTPDTTIDDEPLLVSPFVDELARVTGLEPTTGTAGERRGAREDLQRAMASAEPKTLQSALAAAQEDGHIPNTVADAALRGADCGASRANDALTEHDGQLSTDAIQALDDRLTKSPFSHTRLTRYAKCGFKYMLQTGWGFEDDDDIDPGVSPLVVGSLIHETVEEFFRELQPASGEPVDLQRFDRTTLEQQLLVAGRDAVVHADDFFDDVFAQSLLRRLFGGLATPEENEFDARDGTGRAAVRGTFLQFLEHELERAKDGYQPTYFEADVGDDDGIDLADQTIPVGGIVDRVDTTVENDGVTVLDYKSSSKAGARRRENHARDGVDFQLPLYMLGAPSLFEDRSDLQPSAVDAHYYVINDGPTVTIRSSLANRFDDLDMDAFLNDVFVDRVDQVQTGISEGAFQPAIVGAQTAKCEYCEFSDVCDVRHHRRYDVIEWIDEADAPPYVPDGARPGDIREYLSGGDDDD